MTLISDLEITKRARRNRRTESIRQLLCENRLHPSNFVAPFFVLEGNNRREKVASMPGVERLTIDHLVRQVEQLMTLGVVAVDLFAYVPPEKKDHQGSEAYRSGNLLTQAIKALKEEFPELCVMADIALDPYTTHGHDGIIDENGIVLNDESVDLLAQMSLLAADSGVDVVAPSDMMDGRVGLIRETLDAEGFTNVSILSYTVKFVSAFYGPFRDALGSAPKIGDKKSYQISPSNSREAILECMLDQDEGADMLLVKPALPYLDIISKYKEQSTIPVGAYHVSGEYAMIMAAGEKGWLDAEKAMWESLISIKRAGADFILSYVACQPTFLKKVLDLSR